MTHELLRNPEASFIDWLSDYGPNLYKQQSACEYPESAGNRHHGVWYWKLSGFPLLVV